MLWPYQQVLAVLNLTLSHPKPADQAQTRLSSSEVQAYPFIPFNWSEISPATGLKWHRCYERHECARLLVPMDWYERSFNETVAIAVIRQPVAIPRSDPNYGGSIIVNPGGPGGSGVEFLRWSSYELQSKTTGPKHFDLISFDPRGVEHTTPTPNCFTDDLDRQAFYLMQNAAGAIDENEYSLYTRLAFSEAFGRICNSTIMKHMTTYSTAQDILAIADALQPHIRDPLINYWGISYGTVIGNILASAFPHRIGKFLLDGVVDVDAYLRGSWIDDIANGPHVLDHFYSLCHKAGPKCSLWESTPTRIRAKVDDVLQPLKASPIPILRDGSADILTSSDLRSAIFRALYSPPLSFPTLAQALHDVLQSPVNTTLIARMIPSRLTRGSRNVSPLPATNRSIDNPFPTYHLAQEDAERIIACTDAKPINDWELSDIKHYIDSLLSTFPLAANFWASTTLTCVKWPSHNRAPEHARYRGPFSTNLTQYDIDRGARPILWIGNKADPATPLKHARAMAARHEGSKVLETGIYGHATGPVNSNGCVYGYIKEYFNHGILPEDGAYCEEEVWEWRI